MRILQLVSCRGWSSDAYLAARVTRELERRGHAVTLGCRRGTEAKVIRRARAEGVERIVTFAFESGLGGHADVADVRRLLEWLPRVDTVHVHRGKEHWIAAVANRLSRAPRPIVRTRHIVQPVRPHAANRWLYRRATALVHTVSDAIARQYVVSGLLPPDRIVTLPGGADAEAFRPTPPDAVARQRLGGEAGSPLVGMIGGLRVMKGHHVVIEAAARLGATAPRPRFAFVGRGPMEAAIRDAIQRSGLETRFTLTGFVEQLPMVVTAIDVALYVPLESEGMSRVLFEYLAAARAVIAARVGVVVDVLRDHQHAILVPAGDPDALASALAELLGDAALRGRLGRAGRDLLLERYSGARLAESLEAHYRRLAALPGDATTPS
jgi:glycosyltransferase involved in cell wall biosynthesis